MLPPLLVIMKLTQDPDTCCKGTGLQSPRNTAEYSILANSITLPKINIWEQTAGNPGCPSGLLSDFLKYGLRPTNRVDTSDEPLEVNKMRLPRLPANPSMHTALPLRGTGCSHRLQRLCYPLSSNSTSYLGQFLFSMYYTFKHLQPPVVHKLSSLKIASRSAVHKSHAAVTAVAPKQCILEIISKVDTSILH